MLLICFTILKSLCFLKPLLKFNIKYYLLFFSQITEETQLKIRDSKTQIRTKIHQIRK